MIDAVASTRRWGFGFGERRNGVHGLLASGLERLDGMTRRPNAMYGGAWRGRRADLL